MGFNKVIYVIWGGIVLAIMCWWPPATVSLSPNEEQYVTRHMAGVMVLVQSGSASWDMLR